MDAGRPALNVVPFTAPPDDAIAAAAIPSAPPKIRKAVAQLTPHERAVWRDLVRPLSEYGLAHQTDWALLLVITRVLSQWITVERQLEEYRASNGGSYMAKTPNGYEQPHQLYYMAKDLKRQLLQWLPEAALTIPSFAKLTGDEELPKTGELFEDPVTVFRNRKQAMHGSGA